jgi:hypothetical protein
LSVSARGRLRSVEHLIDLPNPTRAAGNSVVASTLEVASGVPWVTGMLVPRYSSQERHFGEVQRRFPSWWMV